MGKESGFPTIVKMICGGILSARRRQLQEVSKPLNSLSLSLLFSTRRMLIYHSILKQDLVVADNWERYPTELCDKTFELKWEMKSRFVRGDGKPMFGS